MNAAPSVPSDLLVLAGSGELPRLVIEGARAAGVARIGVLGVRGATPRRTLALGDWASRIPFSVSRFREAMAASGFKHAILAGQIPPLAFFSARFDAELVAMLREMRAHNAHTIFRRLIREIESTGASVLPSSLFLAAHLPAPGVLSAREPTEAERRDIEFGLSLAMAVCDLDIGQTVVVKDGVALAIEGFEGTNSTILRGGRIARRGGVVVKVAKHGHDMRFDIPVVGLKTLRVMRRARCTTLAIQAGRTLFIDRPEFLRRADRLDIAVVALDSGLPAAPTLPSARP